MPRILSKFALLLSCSVISLAFFLSVDSAQAQDAAVENVSSNNPIWTYGGEISATARYFPDNALYIGQNSDDFVPIFEARLMANGTWNDGMHRIGLEAYGRYDSEAGNSIYDLPEAYYQYVGDAHSFLIGSHTEFWGVAESYNPVNIINQKDDSSDIRSRMALGQPMAKLALSDPEYGTLELFGLFGFREREYGDRSSRFRSPFVVDEDLVTYEDQRDIDIALRYSNSIAIGQGSMDFAVSYFNGTDRDPTLLPACVRKGGPITKRVCNRINDAIVNIYEARPNVGGGGRLKRLRRFIRNNFDDDTARFLSGLESVGLQPYYQHLEQVGLEMVYGIDNVQAKFEGAWKRAGGESYVSMVTGLEYTMNNFAGTEATVSLIGEYLYDNRSFWQPVTPFDNDVFGGVRVGFNDTNNTELKAGVFHDLDTSATIGTLEFSRRLTDSTKLEVSANIFGTDGWNDPLAAISHDSFVDMKVTAFF
jgi:hypothetical protein